MVIPLCEMLKLCISFVFLGAVFAGTNIYNPKNEQNLPFDPFSEVPCLSFGGICVLAQDCPEGQLTKFKGLCPVQQRLGVECCHGLPVSETRCKRRGGECMPRSTRCPEKLTYKEATDCETNEKCCILVN